ncbi:uncharacterized protein PAC_13809 [Phialocephala subalpina]|uniref:Uncharacterized protein n=1 Tax=Phialocephala subalpina TaxID=576137 RepID=A0A1L7XFV8_9HELO|nr:uncharacterized protein PAC_13809 [Phialocephala subalpina]
MALARIPNISVSIDDCISFPAFGPATHLSSPLRKMLHPLLAAATSDPKLKRLEFTIRASVLTDIYRSVRDCRYRKVLTALEAIESVLPETVCEKWGNWEEEIGFEKEIVVVKERDGPVCAWGRCGEEEMLDEVERWELVCQDLNNFFGGRLSWGKEGMLWDERERAGNLSGICAEIRKKHEAEDNE